ncbi:TIGR04014 family B12-binding domain/radical SAM domain-containing protein [Methanothermobacter thermautotrophicus]|uniref:methyl-coenzyme M reductase glutamine C-methyltransferase n=1 Tax=Methanothermobacter thermautotrophicus TaxID=145262 RepID=UPI0022B8A749|nr:methyl-coenzyme M reductase glutamine C-methyltransferase [Methanothermobacter thermautotrophicus]WBF05729.1 TIGR04014 family B12-binding domain/radical SAM domain-containing protein [Methanothermobacter thermautotrophicus]
MSRVTVVTPEHYNYGSMLIAGALRDLGHRVEIRKGFDGVKSEIVFISLQSTIHLLRYRDIINKMGGFRVVGGPVSIDPEMVFRYLDVDLVVMGEGEDKVGPVMELAAGNCKPEDVPGAAFRSPEGIVVSESSPCPMERPLPLVPGDISREDIRGASVYIETHRGCPGNCTFCQVPEFFGRNVRSRPLKDIIMEVRELKSSGARRFAISGGTGTLYGSSKFRGIDEEAFRDLLRCISEVTGSRNLTVPDIRVDMVSPEILDAISEYTNGWVFYGIESGSRRMLRKMKKGITPDQVVEAVELAREYNLKVAGSFIVGYPGEDDDDYQETLELADELMLDDYFVSIAEPLPGTELGEEVMELPEDENPVFMKSSNRRFDSLAEERAFNLLLESYVFRSVPVPMTSRLLKSITEEVRQQQEHIRTVTGMLKGKL